MIDQKNKRGPSLEAIEAARGICGRTRSSYGEALVLLLAEAWEAGRANGEASVRDGAMSDVWKIVADRDATIRSHETEHDRLVRVIVADRDEVGDLRDALASAERDKALLVKQLDKSTDAIVGAERRGIERERERAVAWLREEGQDSTAMRFERAALALDGAEPPKETGEGGRAEAVEQTLLDLERISGATMEGRGIK